MWHPPAALLPLPGQLLCHHCYLIHRLRRPMVAAANKNLLGYPLQWWQDFFRGLIDNKCTRHENRVEEASNSGTEPTNCLLAESPEILILCDESNLKSGPPSPLHADNAPPPDPVATFPARFKTKRRNREREGGNKRPEGKKICPPQRTGGAGILGDLKQQGHATRFNRQWQDLLLRVR